MPVASYYSFKRELLVANLVNEVGVLWISLWIAGAATVLWIGFIRMSIWTREKFCRSRVICAFAVELLCSHLFTWQTSTWRLWRKDSDIFTCIALSDIPARTAHGPLHMQNHFEHEMHSCGRAHDVLAVLDWYKESRCREKWWFILIVWIAVTE